MNEQTHNEQSIMNKAAWRCYFTEIMIIIIAYSIEVVKHNRTLASFLTTTLLLLIPAIISFLLIRRNPSGSLAKYFITIGFFIPYVFLLFTASNNLVFTYGVLMMVVTVMFLNRLFSIISSCFYAAVNIGNVVFKAVTVGLTKEDIVTSEIQVALIIICGIFAVVLTHVIIQCSNLKMAEIVKERENVTSLLDHMMTTSSEITDGIEKVNTMMEQLDESVTQTCSAMQEVNAGSAETADSVQQQLVMTEEIQNQIQEVSKNADAITENMEQAMTAISHGNVNMEKLSTQAEKSEQSGNEVATQLQALEEYTKQMHSIIELINSVATQTSLLSLNASIEAARAGEAGRGFSVVATEISNLANQTQEATNNIEKLIGNISQKLEGVVSAINDLIEANTIQFQAAEETAVSFTQIEGSSKCIEEKISELVESVSKLAKANESIVDSIQNISAITEEVSSHSNETLEISQQNSTIVQDVSTIVTSLSEKAESLKQEEEA